MTESDESRTRPDLERAISQAGVEEIDLEKKNEPTIEYSEKFSSDESDLEANKHNDLAQVVSHVTSIATTGTELTGAATNQLPPEKKPWYHKIDPLRRGPIPPLPKERTVSKEFRANFFSMLTFHWINPLMTVGYRRPIELQDIYLVNPERSSELMSRKLNESFKRRAARNEKSPLMWAIYDTLKFEFLLGGVCAFFSAMLQVFSPFALRYLIAYATDAYIATREHKPAPSIGRGLGLVFGITFMQICQSSAANHFIYRGMTVGGQSRAVLINAIFEKSLTISGRAKAGGKAFEGEGVTQDRTNEDAQAEKPTRPALTRMLSNALHPKTGPKITPDAGKGIAGDGTGWNNGKIVGLMSVDTHRVDTASGMFHILWTSPVQIVAVLIVLCVNIGYSALAGYALIMICMPLLTKAIKMLFVRRKKINRVTDQRVTLTQEILGAVRFVKFFGWESSFLDRLKEIRKKEIRMVQVLLSIRNAINAVSMSMPVFAAMVAFIVYSVTGHDVGTASKIFSSLALFNSLRLPLNLLPLVIGQATDASTSLARIQEFLLSEDQTDEVDWQEEGDNAVRVQDATFTWERSITQDENNGKPLTKAQQKMIEKKAKADAREVKSKAKAKKLNLTKELSGSLDSDDNASETTAVEPFRINNIDFSVGRNELLAVIGTVGCGKTSLLAALAGDMRKMGGKVTMVGTRAFCPQYAWIQNATLKENITFGKPYQSKWYNEVIDACALRPDLSILPAGDLTEIGERGITLSGGQKQRLNIARAIYFDADIVLMDDPLSAVDAHVGRHIMDKAICGLMKDKCRILATHQLHVLSRCDRILWLDEGHIRAIDTFENLMSGSSDFQKLMATTAQENEMEKKESVAANPEDVKTDPRAKTKKAAALMQKEDRATKAVSWDVWGAYFKASGRWFLWPLTFMALVTSQGANITTSLWLSFWVQRKFELSTGAYIGVYASLGIMQCLLMFSFSTLLSTNGTNSSKHLLHQAISHVLRAPISFFDTTPLGRITNRFSKDVDSMDNNLTDSMRMYFFTVATIVSVFALIIAYFHYFAAALGPLILIFLFASSYYRASAREMKRHEAVLRSVVFARFSETVSGVASIRAYGLQKYFTARIREAVDDMDSAYFLTFANQRWLAVRLDSIGNILVFITGILVVTNNFNVSPATSGLVLSYILSIVQMIQFTVRQLAEVENNMNATERLYHYGSKLEQEAPLKGFPVSDSWPSAGAITFDKVEMRYRPELPLVLHGLTFSIRGGERIGIVGRTGAGKSSIMSALFRLTELSSGKISIDDIDISQVGLQDLRSRLAIIPQDPTLFRGTVRSNLDPFNEHSDLELWDALRKADLVGAETEHFPTATPVDEKNATTETLTAPPRTPTEKSARITLDTPVEEEGLNFSLGQRQLMALSRALVRNARIIVCDEATSSVDFETDEKIQRTMKVGFQGKTVLCIAHRLKTIIGYDRICVMDKGEVREMGVPIELWEMGGVFRGMCDKSGIAREDFFRE